MDNAQQPALEVKQLALLEFDDVILGIPQDQVLTIESLKQINTLQSTDKSSGTLPFSSAELPVYTLDRDLTLMPQPAIDNRFCIALKHPDANEYFALTCDAVNQFFIEDNTGISAMPSLMNNPDSPVVGLIKKEDRLVLMTSAESMRSYINSNEGVIYV